MVALHFQVPNSVPVAVAAEQVILKFSGLKQLFKFAHNIVGQILGRPSWAVFTWHVSCNRSRFWSSLNIKDGTLTCLTVNAVSSEGFRGCEQECPLRHLRHSSSRVAGPLTWQGDAPERVSQENQVQVAWPFQISLVYHVASFYHYSIGWKQVTKVSPYSRQEVRHSTS